MSEPAGFAEAKDRLMCEATAVAEEQARRSCEPEIVTRMRFRRDLTDRLQQDDPTAQVAVEQPSPGVYSATIYRVATSAD